MAASRSRVGKQTAHRAAWHLSVGLCAAWTLVTTVGLLAARRLASTDAIEVAALSQHERAAEIPVARFREDRARRISGRVTDANGRPLRGVRVRVFDQPSLLQSADGLPPGHWYEAVPEAESWTDREGEYVTTEPGYGAKCLLFEAEGFLPVGRQDLSLQDGSGAASVDVALPPCRGLKVTLRDPEGQPWVGLPVRLLPRQFGQEMVDRVSDGEGAIEVPASTRSSNGEPHLLLGRPGLLLDASAVDWTAGIARTPARRPLTLQLEGAEEGAVEAILLPRGARRVGQEPRQLVCRQGMARIDSLWCAAYELIVRQGTRRALVEFTHDGSPRRVPLREAAELHLRLRSRQGDGVDGSVHWQSRAFDAATRFLAGPLAALEAQDPLYRTAQRVTRGSLHLTDLPRADGWILVEAPGHAPWAEPVDATFPTELEIEVPPGHEGSLRTPLPYQAVSVQPHGQPEQVGRSDAFCEAFYRAAPGPVVLHTGYPGGGVSYPLGYWLGSAAEPPCFTRLDLHSGEGGCVHGFVTDAHGQPVSGADVLLSSQRAPARKTRTDASGFFRFEELPVGTYALCCRANDDLDALRWLTEVTLPDAPTPGERECRKDLTLWPGGIDLALDAPEPSTVLRLATQEDGCIWRAWPREDGHIRVHNLPPGQYALSLHPTEDAPGLDLPPLRIDPGHTAPVRRRAGALIGGQ